MLARTAALAATAVALLIAPAGAGAAKVGIDFYSGDIGVAGGYIPEYVADPGEVNDPTADVTTVGTTTIVTFHDPVATISADPPTHVEGYQDSPCTLVDPHTADCVLPDPRWIQHEGQSLAAVYAAEGRLSYVRIDLGDRNDSYAAAIPGLGAGSFTLDLFGGDGNDTLHTGPGETVAHGGAGNDFVYAANGQADFVYCGDGTDHVRSLDPGDGTWTDCEDVSSP